RLSSSAVLTVLAFFAYLGFLFRWPIATAACLLLAAGLAYRTARFLAARIERFSRFARASLMVMTAWLAATLVVCTGYQTVSRMRPPPRPVNDANRPTNVLLVVLDTVRAESLSLYGYDRDTTPNLARLAKRGVRFDRAFSTA